MDLDDFAGDDEIAAALREVYRLRRENTQLRALVAQLRAALGERPDTTPQAPAEGS